MVRRNQVVLLGICVLVIAAWSISAATATPRPVDKYCDVAMGKTSLKPAVSVDPLVLRAKHDRAVWRSSSRIAIRFADGVDTPKCDEQKGGGWRCVSRVFNEPGKHKYSVVMTDAKGKQSVLDPEIDIRPCDSNCN